MKIAALTLALIGLSNFAHASRSVTETLNCINNDGTTGTLVYHLKGGYSQLRDTDAISGMLILAKLDGKTSGRTILLTGHANHYATGLNFSFKGATDSDIELNLQAPGSQVPDELILPVTNERQEKMPHVIELGCRTPAN